MCRWSVSVRTLNKTVHVYDKQQRFLESKVLWRAFCGGIGSGKSYIGSLDMIRRAKPGRLYLVTAPTYQVLSDSSLRSFVGLAEQLEVVVPAGIKRSAPPSVKLRTGAEVLFRSADDPDMLRGPNLSGVWMDEASLIHRDVFDILIGRLREGGEMGWGTATFTPKGTAHWTYKKFGVGAPDTELIRASSSENMFLPENFVKSVRDQYTQQQSRQELEGLFVDADGNQYFPDTWPRYRDTGDAYRVRDGDRWSHVRKSDCSRLIALDWAMGKPKRKKNTSGDCTAFVVADLTDNGQLFILGAFNEHVPLGSNAARLAEQCRRWNPAVVAGDNDNLSEAMLLECARYPDIPSVKCVPMRGRNKLVRSQSAIIRAERGQVYVPDVERPWLSELCGQLASFTGADGAADDLADCMGLLGRLADEYTPGTTFDDEYEPLLGSWGYNASWN
jgi:phage terminase large subunit-like protein